MEAHEVETLKSIERPSQAILDRIVDSWQKDLATSRKAQSYVKGRGLWHPELLRGLRMGYSSGKLPQAIPANGKLKRQLERMGFLNDRGNEFFYNRLVVPLFDDAGILVNVYGRTLSPENTAPHLYLPGPRRGVFNRVGIRDASTVILTESIIDAISLQVLGFQQITASFGVTGFTADLRATLVKSQTKRVYCVYDADPAGDQGADQLAHDLAGHGMEVLRVGLPCKDPNDFLKGGGTREDFQKWLDKATLVPVNSAAPIKVTAPKSSAMESAPSLPPPSAPTMSAASIPAAFSNEEELLPPSSSALTVTLGDRVYQIETLPATTAGQLQAILRVTRQTRTFVDTLNLYSDRARAAFVSRAFTAFRGQVLKKALEEDFFALLDEVETKGRTEAPPPTAAPSMTDAEHQEAVDFLRRPDLILQMLEDLMRLGVVGEEDNKCLTYLVATSRKLAKPLSLSVISRASAGKSWLLNRVVDLMPPEEVLRYTRMSPRALFYDEPGRYKHKILCIEEAIGAKDADLGVRSMQSEKRLANLATMTDPKTGQLKTQETVVEGPLTYMTSSVEPLDHETATRSFEIAIDESAAQTQRVVAQQFHERTLEGLQERLTGEAILRRHRNAQRLLQSLLIVNPYAPQLTFPCETLRLRREAGKYLSLIDTLAFLHQHQRPIRTFELDAVKHQYVEVTREDIDRANRLMASCLVRALSDLSGPAEQLLMQIRDYVLGQVQGRSGDALEVPFSRREIRERLEWSDHHARPLLEELIELEYVEAVSGSFGKRYVYTLTPDHRLLVRAGLSIEERIVALGLKPAHGLVDPAEFRPQRDLERKR